MKKQELINAIVRLDNRLFFPYASSEELESYYVHREQTPEGYIQYMPFDGPEDLNSYFKECTEGWWPMEKFHFCYTEDCLIEPSIGWVVANDRLIPQSLWNNYIHKVNKPSYLKYKLQRKQKLYIERAISLHYAWGNYWHFQNDILGQLSLADAAGLPKDIPIVIAAGLTNMSYFKEIVSLSPDLQSRNWILQDKQTTIHCNEVHLFHTWWDHKDNFDAVKKYIGFQVSLKNNHSKNRKIFIDRNKNRGRNIQNIEAIYQVLRKYNFDLIDCDNLTVQEQIEVFRAASHVIGIHGAGLTNIMYREGSPMKLLEIFSDKYFNPCYYWLCLQYGYEYTGIVGAATDSSGGSLGTFTIDVMDFEAKIIRMLA